jgi:hypothetical protein
MRQHFETESKKSVTVAECGTWLHFVWNEARSEVPGSLECLSGMFDSTPMTIYVIVGLLVLGSFSVFPVSLHF